MTATIKKLSGGLLAATLIFSSCKKSDGGEVNDEELITTIKLTFSPVAGGTPAVFTYKDIDGPGGAAPIQDNIQLTAGAAYNVAVAVLNESVTPAEDITPEIVEEADAHRFYFTPSAGSTLTISNLSTDPDGVPVGLTSIWTAGAASAGTVAIVLRHYPGTPPDKQTSDPVNSPKSGTDASVNFNYSIL